MKIIVTKLGAVLRTTDSGSAPRGERGETEGLIKHLVDEGHDVLYFGRVEGRLPPEVRVVVPHTDGLDPYSPAQLQYDMWQLDAEAVASQGFCDVSCYIQVAGSTASFMIDSPTYCTPRQIDVARTGPAKALAHRWKIPIIMVNNDPRTYPREVEMGTCWPEIAPVALLDNWANAKKRTIGGTQFEQRSVHAWSESWGVFPAIEKTTRSTFAVICAQAHLATGVREEGRRQGWETCLSGALPDCEDFQVYGDGWDSLWKVHDRLVLYGDKFHPPVGGIEAMQLYAGARFSPCVGYEQNRSGKAYMIVAAGCVPRLYGDGQDPHTWDRDGLVVPLDHPSRITSSQWHVDPINETEWQTWRDEMRYRLVPRWDVLDACLADLDMGLLTSDRDLWHERYGGYQCAR
jgi:hypothetical protein